MQVQMLKLRYQASALTFNLLITVFKLRKECHVMKEQGIERIVLIVIFKYLTLGLTLYSF